jgi:hypothetical protein
MPSSFHPTAECFSIPLSIICSSQLDPIFLRHTKGHWRLSVPASTLYDMSWLEGNIEWNSFNEDTKPTCTSYLSNDVEDIRQPYHIPDSSARAEPFNCTPIDSDLSIDRTCPPSSAPGIFLYQENPSSHPCDETWASRFKASRFNDDLFACTAPRSPAKHHSHKIKTNHAQSSRSSTRRHGKQKAK